MPSRLIAGAMSGTSADGVDVAIVEVTGRGLAMTAKPLAHAYEPFSTELRQQILEVRQRGEVRLADLAHLGRQVTLAHVPAFKAACAKANISADQIEAIAAHGQTLWHGPPDTIQYFDPSLLAYETGCAVVSDFRRADLAAGGQGAPLVPFADWILFRHPTKSRVILNIGGIANLTYLKAGGAIEDVIAFDTGPGNCLSDWLCRSFNPGGPGFDAGGLLASEGTPNATTATKQLTHLLFRNIDAFAATTFPRSTDGPAMVGLFQQQLSLVESKVDLPDMLSIANSLVAATVRRSAVLAGIVPEQCEWLVGGGGAQNVDLMESLFAVVHVDIQPLGKTEEIDLAAAREAIAFALLGAATLDGEPSNVPSATGAKRRVVLGSITPRPI